MAANNASDHGHRARRKRAAAERERRKRRTLAKTALLTLRKSFLPGALAAMAVPAGLPRPDSSTKPRSPRGFDMT